uniref:Reverse transcriptase domain-containing protein n=1 Tax=Amphimedon queenslandica TaxID=400682 RepID=A0A1X7SVN2_AMPQE
SCRPGGSSSCHNPFGRGPPASGPRVSSPLDSDPANSHPSSLSASGQSDTEALPDPATSSTSGLPSLSTICHLQVPLLYHVPKAARNSWSGILSAALEDVVSRPTDLDSWSRLFMLPKCVLFLPPFRSRRKSHDLLYLIKERLQSWRNGEFLALWDKVTVRAAQLPRTGSSPQSDANVRRARRAVEAGHLSKAIQALSSRGLAPPSHESYLELLSKHPQSPLPASPLPLAPPDSLPPSSPPHTPLSPLPSSIPPSSPSVSPPLFSSPSPPPPTPPSPPPLLPTLFSPPLPSPSLTPAAVLQAVRSFPLDTAPGPTGLRASHIKEAVCCPSPCRAQSTLQQLTLFVVFLSSGDCPSSVIPHLCGATLLASLKKSGGLRPIAVGEVLRRLTSKCLSSLVLPQVRHILPPHQVGVGCSNGAESIVHSLKLILANQSIPSNSKCCLLLDFSNAFNCINRLSMFSEVRSKIPLLSNWVECCYGAQPNLLFGDYIIPSCCGVQQGDPLGPLLFSLVLQPIVERLESEVPGLVLNSWYLDDGVLCGSSDDLLAALTIIEDLGPSHGLHLNLSKSLLYLPPDIASNPHPLPSAIPSTSVGFVLLGAPVGPPDFCRSIVQERVESIKASLELLPLLEDSQSQFSLLRSCLGLPKLLCALRTTSPDVLSSVTMDFDAIIFDFLSELVGGSLTSWSRCKAALPIKLGGVGLRLASQHSSAIFLASVTACSPLILSLSGQEVPPSYVSAALVAFASSAELSDLTSISELDLPISQKSLSGLIDKVNYNALLSSTQDIRSKALLLSSSIPHAGDWIGVLPSPNLGLHLLDCEFRLCLRYCPSCCPLPSQGDPVPCA